MLASLAALLIADAGSTVTIIPLGSVSKTELSAVSKRIQKTYHLQVTISKSKPFPKSAYYAPRSRYRAEKLLKWLDGQAKTEYVLGISSKDISATAHGVYDWGLLGLGYQPGRTAVVSTFRLKKKGPISELERLCRVSIHELGHNLGLPHCPNHCIMADGAGSIKNLDAWGNFCPVCRKRLGL